MKKCAAAPLVSVIVPVYNVEKYLPRCLDSLVNQTYENLELLLVDDGSADSSGEICDAYAAKDNRIRVFHIPNGGVSNARNLALDNMTGDYVTFVDSDDWLDDNWIKIAIDSVIKKEAELFLSNIVRVSGSDRNPWIMWENFHKCIDNVEFLKRSFKSDFPCWAICGKLWKAEYWKDVRFNCDLVMDEDLDVFWHRLIKYAKNIIYNAEAEYNYFAREGSAVTIASNKHYLDLYRVEDSVLADNKWHGDLELERLVHGHFFIHKFILLCQLSLLDGNDRFVEAEQKRMRRGIGDNLVAAYAYRGIKGMFIALLTYFPEKLWGIFEVWRNERDIALVFSFLKGKVWNKS